VSRGQEGRGETKRKAVKSPGTAYDRGRRKKDGSKRCPTEKKKEPRNGDGTSVEKKKAPAGAHPRRQWIEGEGQRKEKKKKKGPKTAKTFRTGRKEGRKNRSITNKRGGVGKKKKKKRHSVTFRT